MYELRVVSGVPDSEKRSCSDCRHMQAAVSWWCQNENAIKARMTKIPGVHGCPYWEPAKPAVSFWKKLLDWKEFDTIDITCNDESKGEP